MQGFEDLYSLGARNMRKSEIRELLKLTNRPDIISFAGGLPAPETFPAEDLAEAAATVLANQASSSLQYGTTEGDPGLKERIVELEAAAGTDTTPANLLVVSGSQQALDLLPKLFLDPGDCVIAGRPTYVGAIQAIQSYRGRMLGIPFAGAGDGFDMDMLEESCRRTRAAGGRIKYIYVIPDFQNPAGLCWSLEKRRALLEFSYREGLPLVEDSPYREIRFLGDHIPSIYQLDALGDRRGNVISLRTFSKILAPGTRTGWVMGNEAVISRLVIAKQAMDLCTNVFTQKVLAEYLASGKLPGRIVRTCGVYREKRNRMIAALRSTMPRRADLRWTEPEGGLFLWLTLPSGTDTGTMLGDALRARVAYVTGSAFYFDDPERNSMRLNFSYPSHGEIAEGIARLADVVRASLAPGG